MRQFRALLFVLLCSVLPLPLSAQAGRYYKWTDDAGNVHISDSLSSVPQKYRGQIESRRFEEREPEESDRERPAITIPAADAPQPSSPGKPLKRYEIPYTAYEGTARRIIINAVLNNTVNAKLAIDTGAPGTIITPALADKLGLQDKDHGTLLIRTGGIGGTAPAVRTIIDTIEVGGARSAFVPTTVTAKISDAFDGLLGMDFVANYAVTIDSVKNVVIFEELPVNPEHPGGHDKIWWTSLFKEFAEYRAHWKEYGESLERKIRSDIVSDPNDKKAKAFAEMQYREAEKLSDKLNRYAREHYVPMHWRKY